jgi:hypothetical protein
VKYDGIEYAALPVKPVLSHQMNQRPPPWVPLMSDIRERSSGAALKSFVNVILAKRDAVGSRSVWHPDMAAASDGAFAVFAQRGK